MESKDSENFSHDTAGKLHQKISKIANSITDRVDKDNLHDRLSILEDHRYSFAQWILWAFLGLAVVIICAVFLYNKFVIIPLFTTQNTKTILNKFWDLESLLFMVISTFGTILGFVIGYYFKESNNS